MTRMRAMPLALALLASVLTGCGEPTAFTGFTIENFLVSVGLAEEDVQGSFSSRSAPSPRNGPVADVDMAGALIPGGSQFARVTAGTPFDEVIVSMAGRRGFFRVDLPEAVTSVALMLGVREDPPTGTFNLRIAVGSGGTIGPYHNVPVTLLDVGTGEVQVSVSWDAPSDVDLHVVDPMGEEIYYGNPSSASGGELDLDANAACSIRNPPVNQENTTWETAPSGEYLVRLNYWSACGVEETNYVVVVRVDGQETRSFRGTFTGPGNGGGEGDGIPITQFTF